MKHGPRKRGRTRMLASHKQGNQDVGNLVVGERSAIAVLLLHEGVHDVVFAFLSNREHGYVGNMTIEPTCSGIDRRARMRLW